jgi:predicted homoserine dehydrogenase-like protein
MGLAKSCRNGYPSIGLANDVTLKTHIVKGQYIRFSDVKINKTSMAYKFRRELEAVFDSVGGLI